MSPQTMFNQVAKPKIQRSTFDRSHGHKTTFDAGKLIPIYIDEALPGDTFNMKAHLFGRLATPLKPVMDNIMMDLHFFSVPNRILWSNFKKFMGEQVDPADSIDYLEPTMTAPGAGYGEGTMFDHLGIPTKVANIEHRSIFLRAIHKIYNDFYRDENLQDSVHEDLGDGPDTYTNYQSLLPRGKRKDYFTSALPWPQKGAAVTIPIGTAADIRHNTATTGDISVYSDVNTAWHKMNAGSTFVEASATAGVEGNKLYADLSNASAQTINTLREAFQIQKMLERDARGGTRYTEMVYNHFGVVSPDARLQRPEYLGGGTSYINMTPIANTSGTATENQGDLAAMATINSTGNGFIKSFTEHEIVVGFVSVRADLTYQQGLNKMWSRSTRYDHFFPSFAHLGEQPILNQEIYMQGAAADTDVFGYAERYSEYRYKPSQITGLFRSNAVASLDVWHLSQDFSALPSLNASFIEETPPIDRVVAVPSEPDVILDAYFDLKCTRPMPVRSIPGFIDHF